MRDSGPVDAPAIVFLHGGIMSGWTWEPVVAQMRHYRCLVPDLPQYGKSFPQGPFEMSRAAGAVADLIRTRVTAGRAHLVGFSLGAQVGVQLLASEPYLVDRAVFSSTVINTLPAAQLTRHLAGVFARAAAFRWLLINRYWDVGHAAKNEDYVEDARLHSGAQFAYIAEASAGFTLPRTLDKADVPTLFVTGTNELRPIRHWAALLSRSMPNGVDRLAIGMGHDWPMRNPGLFARTADAWLSGRTLPAELAARPVRGREGRRRDRSHR